MSIFSWLTGSQSSPSSGDQKISDETARNYSRQALKDFWTTAAAEFPENMQMSFEEFYGYMSQRTDSFMVDFGKSCYWLASAPGQDASVVTSAMQDLARKNQGQISQYDDGYPRGSDFFDALLGKFNSWPVSRIAAFAGNVAKSTAEQTTAIAATAVTGYVGVTAAISVVGILFVILSFRKK